MSDPKTKSLEAILKSKWYDFPTDGEPFFGVDRDAACLRFEPKPKPLSRIDRVRLRLADTLERLAAWVSP